MPDEIMESVQFDPRANALLALLQPATPQAIVFVQVEGVAWRLPAADFLEAVRTHEDFGRCMHRYAYALLVQVTQGAACNRAHAAEQRCARWLLHTHDRVDGDTFELTQACGCHGFIGAEYRQVLPA